METGDILRVIICCGGVVLLGITMSSLARRKMTESFCLVWGIISVALILAGILLRPTMWNRYISITGMFLVLLLGFAVVYIAFFLSTRVSELMRKNQELAMQVSLLNLEKDEIRKKLEELEEMSGHMEERSV
ncbi:MAG: DUF2304 family protein [Butyrivibrio sp.]|nr:DUF2304 family protein [Acetatifactor muris]MCM1559254.1 DUF2304 family protein [Butyrivibrio sp.]